MLGKKSNLKALKSFLATKNVSELTTMLHHLTLHCHRYPLSRKPHSHKAKHTDGP